MIVGNGDIAQALIDREGFLFFASGVSNSNCNDEDEFTREKQLLMKLSLSISTCVYFSTISIFEKDTPYTLHKKTMERLISNCFDNYCIIRIGNIDWGKNPNTFLNYLRRKIKNGEPITIIDEYKYMISKDQLLFVTNNIPTVGRNEICVFGYKAKVKDII